MLRSWATFSESSACMDPDDDSDKDDDKEGQSPSRLQSSRGSWGETPRIQQAQPPSQPCQVGNGHLAYLSLLGGGMRKTERKNSN